MVTIKKRKIKKYIIFIVLFIAIFLISFGFIYFGVSFDTKKKIELNLGEEFNYKIASI